MLQMGSGTAPVKIREVHQYRRQLSTPQEDQTTTGEHTQDTDSCVLPGTMFLKIPQPEVFPKGETQNRFRQIHHFHDTDVQPDV